MAAIIVLGISGGIAAYKSPLLVRLLVKKGHQVHCILTEHAEHFVTPTTLAALSGHPVLTGHFEASESGRMSHIELAETAALILVAPATANVIAKMAHGIADDLLSTTLLAAQRTVAVCPAMNVFMWQNKATEENLSLLMGRGITVIGPSPGSLACGYEGMGRMEEPESIVADVEMLLARHDLLRGKKVLITAGPTREYFDPVRFLSNPSSGKMGYALARAALQDGAEVTLVTGPTELPLPMGAQVVRVTSAEEMLRAVKTHFANTDVFISSAAVTDWKPKTFHSEKEKKENANRSIEVDPTPDILAIVSRETKGQILVGFAAETENLESNARKKLQGKNVDLMVANLVSGNGHGAFGSDENEILLLWRSGETKAYPRMKKEQAARVILEAVARRFEDTPGDRGS